MAHVALLDSSFRVPTFAAGEGLEGACPDGGGGGAAFSNTCRYDSACVEVVCKTESMHCKMQMVQHLLVIAAEGLGMPTQLVSHSKGRENSQISSDTEAKNLQFQGQGSIHPRAQAKNSLLTLTRCSLCKTRQLPGKLQGMI